MEKVINIALPKGRLGEKAYKMLEELGYGCKGVTENSRKLIFEEGNVRYFWVKPSDVAIYVERGAADVGVVGKDIYKAMQDVLPQEEHGWGLCPGHLTGEEEWVASPITAVSNIPLRSGMLMQWDLIVDYPNRFGANAEDGIAIADEALRQELAEKYPETWARIQARREWMKNELGINLKEEILPMSDLLGDYRPYMFNREYALKKA